MDWIDLAIVAKHEKPVLQFSGGKDSLACLWLLKDHWPRITVVWVNTQDAFPETLALMDRVRALVPNFVEVKSDQPAHIEYWGYPTDVLPIRSQRNIQNIMWPHPRQPLQSFWACCFENLMTPAVRAMKELGATLVIRGMRRDEMQTTPMRSGDIVEGVQYLFPILEWSSEDVHAYLADKPIGLPEHYAYVDTSLDCRMCTAHLFENEGKRVYMAERHPEAHAEVSRRLEVIAAAIDEDVAHLNAARAAGAQTRH